MVVYPWGSSWEIVQVSEGGVADRSSTGGSSSTAEPTLAI